MLQASDFTYLHASYFISLQINPMSLIHPPIWLVMLSPSCFVLGLRLVLGQPWSVFYLHFPLSWLGTPCLFPELYWLLFVSFYQIRLYHKARLWFHIIGFVLKIIRLDLAAGFKFYIFRFYSKYNIVRSFKREVVIFISWDTIHLVSEILH
jgi:hypothetical protein